MYYNGKEGRTAQTLFVLFINDLPQVVESPVALFADDTKVFREIQSDEDRQKLQQDIDELLIWSQKWQLPFNESKYKVMHYGKTNRKADYNLGGVNIKEVSEEKDLGVTFDQQLSFGTNASKVVAAANSRLGLINRHFRHLDTKPFMNLYKKHWSGLKWSTAWQLPNQYSRKTKRR